MLLRSLFLVVLILGSAAQAEEPVILVVGDSLGAARGIPLDQGWVNLLDQRIRTQGYKYRVVNASISGETSRGGLTRLPGLLERNHPALVIVELGGNDGLQGQPLDALEHNLNDMADLAAAAGVRFVLIGMQMPVNYGPDYTRGFREVFQNVAQREDVAFVPFLLEGFAEDLDAFQDDGIHPTVEVQPIMLDNVWCVLAPLLEQMADPVPGARPDQAVTGTESG